MDLRVSVVSLVVWWLMLADLGVDDVILDV
jgi:hypothetical protein